ncbi:hypothetical protein LNKW23_25650 [Paralimibaculum aggregatum]|uniref:DUF1127 domain-containing protein n=1 Tax=Paralimibaculum aggregatum TaxID=3036245 RepID=A0ABQ6LK42_9RHOB|nr:hypothetical protein [Limibaculum sp. NKW23]GMG83352.1 hypothetical protein LNKW23_25650 [Limibaculum sp. NKW23]
MTIMPHPAGQQPHLLARLAAWIEGLRTADTLRAMSPDRREDLGLSLADMGRLGA